MATIVQWDSVSSEPLPNSAAQIETEPNNVLSQKESVSDHIEISPPLATDTVEETNLGGDDVEDVPGHVVQFRIYTLLTRAKSGNCLTDQELVVLLYKAPATFSSQSLRHPQEMTLEKRGKLKQRRFAG